MHTHKLDFLLLFKRLSFFSLKHILKRILISVNGQNHRFNIFLCSIPFGIVQTLSSLTSCQKLAQKHLRYACVMRTADNSMKCIFSFILHTTNHTSIEKMGQLIAQHIFLTSAKGSVCVCFYFSCFLCIIKVKIVN